MLVRLRHENRLVRVRKNIMFRPKMSYKVTIKKSARLTFCSRCHYIKRTWDLLAILHLNKASDKNLNFSKFIWLLSCDCLKIFDTHFAGLSCQTNLCCTIWFVLGCDKVFISNISTTWFGLDWPQAQCCFHNKGNSHNISINGYKIKWFKSRKSRIKFMLCMWT